MKQDNRKLLIGLGVVVIGLLLFLTQCRDGGSSTYAVGDIGPGGGVVFYVSTTGFASPGSDCGDSCYYLEAAPAEEWGTDVWCSNSSDDLGATGKEIGQGMTNTIAAEGTCTLGAIQFAFDYSNRDKSDWHLPSIDELNELCKFARSQSTGDVSQECDSTGTLRSGFSINWYWSSTEDLCCFAEVMEFEDGSRNNKFKDAKLDPPGFHIRPVRAFG